MDLVPMDLVPMDLAQMDLDRWDGLIGVGAACCGK
jgi:hypothetical protein